jgi:putative aminopeptidase FrvX
MKDEFRNAATTQNLAPDTAYLLDVLQRLIEVRSPAGHAQPGIEACKRELEALDGSLEISQTRKGVLLTTLRGERDDAPRAITAHIDTLGAQVKEIKPNGRLKLAQIGSFNWLAVTNENVEIETASGDFLRGTILATNPSYHVHKPDDRVDNVPRSMDTTEVRLDARVSSQHDVRELGIEVGDFVHFDTRFQVHNGFVKSRFLDDKACLACVFAAMRVLTSQGLKPAQTTTIHIANYEEVCHGGASGIPAGTSEVLAVDVAPLGAGQNSDEFSCTLCTLDDDGPYSHSFNSRLRKLARENHIALKPDVFIQFSSDAKALWRAGADLQVALVGPGVHNTHGYERTHLDALTATTQLLVAYLLSTQ